MDSIDSFEEIRMLRQVNLPVGGRLRHTMSLMNVRHVTEQSSAS